MNVKTTPWPKAAAITNLEGTRILSFMANALRRRASADARQLAEVATFFPHVTTAIVQNKGSTQGIYKNCILYKI